MKKILIFPSGTKNNEYLNRMGEIFRKAGYDTVTLSLKEVLRSIRSGQKFAYLNWIENQTRQRGLVGLGLIFGMLCLLKILGYKIIWVQHNKVSHNVSGRYARGLNAFSMYIIKRFSDYIVCHGKRFSKLSGANYLPHPTYKESLIECRDIDSLRSGFQHYYLMFGRMQPYKKIEEFLLSCSNCNLIIAGKFDSQYLKYVESVISSSEANVKVINRFISDEEVEGLVKLSSGVVVTNDGASSVVSGVVYHILSLGGTVFTSSKTLYNEMAPLRNFYLIDSWDKINIKDRASDTNEDLFYLNSDVKIITAFEKMVSEI